ncbi:streptomycin 6-kinase [Cohaesibacter sp. ES.047]|uniref:aminoglycoside phosphotransferase family protein n=1 Tax=Cohaesibacter sp. ES.047 TaxID=1798205 RepID=UPI000BBFAD86|nr:aminoglycoside phosphotransferase family protein [Cohaesibacter sp. ES.047]SNY93117.1 streptomycin 6-kinase [Cohaesibacter sp. ES.047]
MIKPITQHEKVRQSLGWLAEVETGQDWLNRLPTTLQHVCWQWGLELAGEPHGGGSVSLVLPVVKRGIATPMVLKIQWPHRECRDEAAALRIWNGNGAIYLLDHDPLNHALLLEACRPGTFLAGGMRTALAVYADILPRLWVKTDEPVRRLEEEARMWMKNLHLIREQSSPDMVPLIDCALNWGTRLIDTQGEQVLLHQDLHGHNVLAAERTPWLAIDPKPLIGEREFALASIVRGFEFGHSKIETMTRLDQLCRMFHLNRERALGWTILQTVAWCQGSPHEKMHCETVRWLMEEGGGRDRATS